MASLSVRVLLPPRSAGELAAPPWGAGAGVRVRVFWQRTGLDRALAAGADPASSRELAARAGQLTGVRGRGLAAQSLERVVEAAAGSPDGQLPSAVVAPDVGALRANRSALHDLLDRLRSPEPVRPAGAARLLELLRDGGGPLYRAGSPGALLAELDRIHRALSG